MQNNLLDGKTIVVTGGATGIGQAFALTSAAHGARVMIADMNPADETLDLIKGNGGEASYVETDVSNAHSAQSMAEATIKWTGRIDGLINKQPIFEK